MKKLLFILLLFAGSIIKADAPLPAHATYYGSSWYCDFGYKRVGNYCEKITNSGGINSIRIYGGPSDIKVRGYFRKNGTYVHPHHRTKADNNFYNNWSTYGNTNPYTGKKGYKYKTTVPLLPSSNYIKVKGYYRKNGTYVRPHVRRKTK